MRDTLKGGAADFVLDFVTGLVAVDTHLASSLFFDEDRDCLGVTAEFAIARRDPRE